jgi:hypothetical protein
MKWEQVTTFRLRRQHLLERAPVGDLIPVVEDMAGAQAQLLPAAKLSLWARIRDLQSSNIEQALQERALVKAAGMRRTLFLLPASELAIFIRGSAQRAEKEIRWALGKGVPKQVLEAAIAATLDCLDEPRTRPEIAECLSRALGVPVQSVQGGGWGSRQEIAAVRVGELTFPIIYLIHLVSARGVICYGPARGNEPTFVRADAWVPHWQDIPAEQAEGLLLRKYLQTFGPATAADFALWTGITLRGAREIWARQQAGTASVDVEGWQASILREDLDELAQAAPKRVPVRLLPYFDTYLLGHKERRHLVAAEHHASVYRAQGWIAPVVLVDGRVGGIWSQRREGSRLQVQVQALAPFPPRLLSGIQEEAQDLARFLEIPTVDIQID